MKYDACADCGIEKTGYQQGRERCLSCANRLRSLGNTNGAGAKGKIVSQQARKNMSLAKGGDGDLENRKYPGLTTWTRLVKERDGWKCAECDFQGTKGKRDVDAHHVIPKALHPQLATVLFNGVTLCKPCHKEIHSV